MFQGQPGVFSGTRVLTYFFQRVIFHFVFCMNLMSKILFIDRFFASSFFRRASRAPSPRGRGLSGTRLGCVCVCVCVCVFFSIGALFAPEIEGASHKGGGSQNVLGCGFRKARRGPPASEASRPAARVDIVLNMGETDLLEGGGLK